MKPDTIRRLVQRELALIRHPDHIRIGELLIEAKVQLPYGKFTPWLQQNFKLSLATARRWMNAAAAAAERKKAMSEESRR